MHLPGLSRREYASLKVACDGGGVAVIVAFFFFCAFLFFFFLEKKSRTAGVVEK